MILQPYISKCKKGKEFNRINFVKEILKRRDDNIPKYIFYLVDTEKEEELHKILVYDYYCLYPNDERNCNRITDSILKVLYYVLWIIYLLFLMVGAFWFYTGVCSFLMGLFGSDMSIIFRSNILIQDRHKSIICLLVGIVFMVSGIGYAKFVNVINDDRYSLKLKKIEKRIKRGVKKYDKYAKNYYY